MALSDIRTSAGTTLAISATQPATYDETGFEALTFTTVGYVETLGEFGRAYNLVTFNPLAERATVKRKGSYNEGSMTLDLARVTSDAGQAAVITARDSDVSPAFCVTIQDGTKFYFTAQVMSYTTNVGGVDDITRASVGMELDNNVVEVAA